MQSIYLPFIERVIVGSVILFEYLLVCKNYPLTASYVSALTVGNLAVIAVFMFIPMEKPLLIDSEISPLVAYSIGIGGMD